MGSQAIVSYLYIISMSDITCRVAGCAFIRLKWPIVWCLVVYKTIWMAGLLVKMYVCHNVLMYVCLNVCMS